MALTYRQRLYVLLFDVLIELTREVYVNDASQAEDDSLHDVPIRQQVGVVHALVRFDYISHRHFVQRAHYLRVQLDPRKVRQLADQALTDHKVHEEKLSHVQRIVMLFDSVH